LSVRFVLLNFALALAAPL